MASKEQLEQQKRPKRFDPFFGDRELQLAYRALMEGAWSRLDSFMAASDKAWVFTDAMMNPIVDTEPVTVERWFTATDSPYARVFQAGLILRNAGALLANPNRQREAEQAAARAEAILTEVVADRPMMADPWVQLLISGRIAGVGLVQLRERFDQAHTRRPFHPAACREYLQGLTAKWGGSQEAALEFARWVADEAPDNSAAHEVLPAAHIEQGMVDEGFDSMQAYLAQPEVVVELANGAIRALNAVQSPAPVNYLGLFNNYGLALGVHDARTAQLVLDIFDHVDNRPTPYPWSLYREGVMTVFTTIQTERTREANRY